MDTLHYDGLTGCGSGSGTRREEGVCGGMRTERVHARGSRVAKQTFVGTKLQSWPKNIFLFPFTADRPKIFEKKPKDC